MIYLDHAATSAVLPEALNAAWPSLTTEFGNASSTYDLGRAAHDRLEDARARVASVLGARAGDIVFTSGGTEANNTAISGLCLANPRGRHLISARTEHESVLETIDFLERTQGFEVSWLPVTREGHVSLDDISATLRPDTTLVSLMMVNNEIGTVHPIAEIIQVARTVGALVHTDAVQAVGHVPIDVRDLGIDALTFSGHKVGAPKGSGALYVRPGVGLEPLLHGGGQEDGRRSGTENVAWAVALATALEARAYDDLREARLRAMTAEFATRLTTDIPQCRLTGPAVDGDRCGTIVSLVFPGFGGETILLELERRGVIASSGAACAAGRDDPSHVLLACGYSPDDARTSVRFSVNPETTESDMMMAALALRESVTAIAGG